MNYKYVAAALKNNILIQKECRVKVKTFTMLHKISVLIKCCFELSTHQRILKTASRFPEKYEATQLFSLMIIRNVS